MEWRRHDYRDSVYRTEITKLLEWRLVERDGRWQWYICSRHDGDEFLSVCPTGLEFNTLEQGQNHLSLFHSLFRETHEEFDHFVLARGRCSSCGGSIVDTCGPMCMTVCMDCGLEPEQEDENE